MWIAISIVLGIISLIAIIDISEKKKRIYALSYENAYLFLLLHKNSDISSKDIAEFVKDNLEKADKK